MLPPTPPPRDMSQAGGNAYAMGPPKGTPALSAPPRNSAGYGGGGSEKPMVAMPPPKPANSTRLLATPTREIATKRSFATPESSSSTAATASESRPSSAVRGTPGSVRRQLRPPPKAQHSPRTTVRPKFRLPPTRKRSSSSTPSLSKESEAGTNKIQELTSSADVASADKALAVAAANKTVNDAKEESVSAAAEETFVPPKNEESKGEDGQQDSHKDSSMISSSDELPEGWQMLLDESSGRNYYYNERSQETRWERPVSMPAQPRDLVQGEINTRSSDSVDAGSMDHGGLAQESVVGEPHSVSSTAPASSIAISPKVNDSNKIFDTDNNESLCRQEDESSQKMEGWSEVLDEGTGRIYYYNSITQETSWEPPSNYPSKNEESSVVNESGVSGIEHTAKHSVEDKGQVATIPQDQMKIEANEGFAESGEVPVLLHEEMSTEPESTVAIPEETASLKDNRDFGRGESLGENGGGVQYDPSVTCDTSEAAPVTSGVVEAESSSSLKDGKVMHEPEATGSEVGSSLPKNWTEAVDPSSGDKYFFNTVTMETSWMFPGGPSESLQTPTSFGEKEPNAENIPGTSACVSEINPDRSDQIVTNTESDFPEESGQESRLVDEDSTPEQTALPFVESKTLAPGFVEIVDPSTGKSYYHNSATGETTWDFPEENIEGTISSTAEGPDVPDKGTIDAAIVDITENQRKSVDPGVTNEDSLLASQTQDHSPDTNGRNDGGEIDTELPADWESAVDPVHGDIFYYNRITGETSWTRPEEFAEESSGRTGQEECGDRLENIGDSNVEKDSSPGETNTNETDDIPDDNGDVIPKVQDEASSPLPEYWTKARDPSSGDIYFFNTLTQETSWERPSQGDTAAIDQTPNKKLLPEDSGLEEKVDPIGAVTLSKSADDEYPKDETGDKIQSSEWEECIDPQSGATYFFNEMTGETKWKDATAEEKIEIIPSEKDDQKEVVTEHSPCKDIPEEPSNHPVNGKNPDFGHDTKSNIRAQEVQWEECVDPQSGEIYYFNQTTGETSWSKPSATETSKNAGSTETEVEVMDISNGVSSKEDPSENIRIAKQQGEDPSRSLMYGEWSETLDPTSGEKYYYNETTGETSWEKPTPILQTSDANGDAGETPTNDDSPNEKSISENNRSDGTAPSNDGASLQQVVPSNVENMPNEGGKVMSENLGSDQLQMPERTREDNEEHHLPPGWTITVDPSTGSTYYYNVETEETSWDPPESNSLVQKNKNSEEILPAESRAEHREPSSLVEWEEQVDESSGKTYYYNTRDGTVSWEIPSTGTKAGGGESSPVDQEGESSSNENSDINALELEDQRKTHGITGPLAMSHRDDVINYIDSRVEENPNDLLWNLIQIAKKSKGRFRSDEGVGDESSPEYAIVQLLLGNDNSVAGRNQIAHQSPLRDAHSKVSHERLENLLLQGRRHEAVEEAISNQDYATAFLVASLCDRVTYQKAVRQFADKQLRKGTPLHTVALLFSGQLELTLGPSQVFEWGGTDEELLSSWKYHLAAILSNRTPGWDRIVLTLGDRLYNLQNLDAAHFCYMVCGASVQNPLEPDTRVSLLGCDHRDEPSMLLRTRKAVAAFDRTEAYEWVKRQGNPNASIQSFQPYKLIYARRLLDLGREGEALSFFDSIQLCTQAEMEGDAQNPSSGYVSDVEVFKSSNSFASAISELRQRFRSNSLSSAATSEETEKHQSNPAFLGAQEKQGAGLQTRFSAQVTPQGNLFSGNKNKSYPGQLQNMPRGEAGEKGESESASHEINDSFISAKSNLLDVTGYSLTSPNIGKLNEKTQAGQTVPGEPSMQVHEVLEEQAPAPMYAQPPTTTSATPAKPSNPPAPPVSAPAALTGKNNEKSAKEIEKKAAPPVAKSASSWNFGLRGKIIKYFNPDAHEVTLEESDEKAYYDEKLKRWVFPGDNLEELAKPLAPPPTMPSAEKQNNDSTAKNGESPEAPLDPLAMMMAPPKRTPTSLGRSAGPGGLPPTPSTGNNAFSANAGAPPPTFAVFHPKS